jgi:hypothetical protein
MGEVGTFEVCAGAERAPVSGDDPYAQRGFVV